MNRAICREIPKPNIGRDDIEAVDRPHLYLTEPQILFFSRIHMSFRSLPSNFNAARPGPSALIVVGTDWCGHCVAFKPELKAMESSLPARVYWVDGSDKRAAAWKVDGYPTIMYHPSEGGMYRYTGPRTRAGIARFIKSMER
jgi:thiol-disulfide isomerase/thioredoxin